MTMEPVEVETTTVDTQDTTDTPAPTGMVARLRAFVKRHPVVTAVLIAL